MSHIIEKAFSISDLSSAPDFNPALLTFDEYYKIINSTDKWHPDSAYDRPSEEFKNKKKSDYPRLLRQVTIHGRKFEFRWGTESDGLHKQIGVFDGEKMVGAYQDEWGAVLIRVAPEYRGFGIGAILGQLTRQIDPLKTSGGFTPAGYKNFQNVYRNIIRQALQNGLYTRLVKSGEMTLDRAKEILKSASLDQRPKNIEQKDLSNSTPEKWMLYVGDSGDFTLYDRRLKDCYNNNVYEDVNHFWISKYVLGTVLVRVLKHRGAEYGLIVLFGGETDKIKRFMMTCALAWSFDQNILLYVDPDDIGYVNPEFGQIGETTLASGYKRFPVKPLKTFSMKDFAYHEKIFRKSFDKYDEFKDSMLELAYGKFKLESPIQKEWWQK